jgi:hypothetical protein
MLALDIDGVVLNTAGLMLNKFNELFGTNLKEEDWVTYEFEKNFNYPRTKIIQAFRAAIEETIDSPMFYDGAVETLQELSSLNENPLLFVTNREAQWAEIAKRQIETAIGKEIYINHRANYPINNRISKTQRLINLGVTHFLEDDDTWWEDYAKEGIHILTFRRTYNQTGINKLQSKISLKVYEDWEEFRNELPLELRRSA